MTSRRQRGEGSLFQRKSDGRWVGRIELGWYGGKRKRRTVYGATMTEAQNLLRKARREIEEGNRSTASRTLEQWLNVWLADVCPAKPRMRPKTLANYESYARNYLVPALGRVRIDRIGAEHIRQLHKYVRDKGLSATTIGHAHTILSTALADAVRDGWIIRNPATLVKRPANAPGHRRALTIEECRRIFAVIEGEPLASRWHAALLLGLRQGECLGLTWEAVDLDTGTAAIHTQLQRIPWKHGCGGRDCEPSIGPAHCPERRLATLPGYEYRQLRGNLCLVRPKTEGSIRLVPVPPPLVYSLELRAHHWSAAEANPYGLVWATPTGDPIDAGDDRLRWHEILAAAEVEDTDLHSARHTTATLLLALGISEDVRMAILGHSVATTTRGYTHVDLTLLRRAMEQLGASLTQPGITELLP